MLRADVLTMPACTLGPPEPLPALVAAGPANAVVTVADDRIPAADRCYFGYGTGGGAGTLAYPLQDAYDRALQPKRFKTLVLENEILRATFVPDWGGRLWSLFHKPRERELLYVNPVLRLGNLAIRDAWFSGGIEWNVGVRGHCPLTCDPVFAARVRAGDGSDTLRLYEYERGRSIVYQLDISLPPGSPLLYVHVRLRNPHDEEIPMYWWSNIAVEEHPDTRVVVPATAAFRTQYGGAITYAEIPGASGPEDRTYPLNSPHSVDYFFRLADGTPPWIAALDGSGRGLFQTSTRRLRGRKLFAWGSHVGGRRWQEFLTVPASPPYCEIQAGLARTQYECLPMPPHADWQWIETYGLLEADPAAVHATDWRTAVTEVGARVRALAPPEALEQRLADRQEALNRPPDEILHQGSGWGALEECRRRHDGEPPLALAATPFPDTGMGAAQQPWRHLLDHGCLPTRPPSLAPVSWMARTEWEPHLRRATAGDSAWQAWYHLGLVAWATDRRDAAEEDWRHSLAACPNAWAARALAVAHQRRGDVDGACRLWQDALRDAGPLPSLCLEYGQALLRAGRHTALADLAAAITDDLAKQPRLRLLLAWAALAAGDVDTVEAMLNETLIPANIREGETQLSDLWFAWLTKRRERELGRALNDEERGALRRGQPPPAALDFRQRPPESP